MDSKHARKLDGLVDGWRQVETTLDGQLNGTGTAQPTATMGCPTDTRPTGDGQTNSTATSSPSA
jgi:hypothetical protein